MPKKAKKSTAETQTPAVVMSWELMALETEREVLALLRRQVREAELRVQGREAELVARLESGAVVTGDMTAVVGLEVGACRPAWKDVHLAHMSEEHGVDPRTTEAQVRDETHRSEKKVLVIGRKS